MDLFVKGEIAASVRAFDEAARLDSGVAPHLWQRGIAYFYLNQFEEGRRQFEIHRRVNPDDVENAAWWYLCMAKLGKTAEARRELLPVGPDPRVPMREIYDLYAGRGSRSQVMAAAEKTSSEERRLALFYAHLYLGLFADAAGDVETARAELRKAVEQKAGGYMWEVARIHLEALGSKRKRMPAR